MTHMGPRRKGKIPVAVFAPTLNAATTLAQELNVALPVVLCPASTAKIRGQSVSALLVVAECWPLARRVFEEIAPALKEHGADILRVNRIDPRQPIEFAELHLVKGPAVLKAPAPVATPEKPSSQTIQITIPTHCPGIIDPRCKGECTVDSRDNKIMDPDCFRSLS